MEGITVSLAIGLIVSLAVTEVFGITAGGMIVPGYFALSVHQPLDLVVTLLVAGATFGVMRFLSKHIIVFGRRRVVLALLFGFPARHNRTSCRVRLLCRKRQCHLAA